MKMMIRKASQVAALVLLVLGFGVSVQASEWKVGDVIVAVGNGQYMVFANDGTFKETISQGISGATAGCAFNSLFDLYTTNFGNTKVVIFNGTGTTHSPGTPITVGGPSFSAHAESIVFDAAGNFYVGFADSVSGGIIITGGGKVEKYNAGGGFVTSFAPVTESRGSDWIDLSTDQKTLFYTSEGRLVKKFSASACQLADFTATALPGTKPQAFAIRLLPQFDSTTGFTFVDGSGGLLVADSTVIRQLDSAGVTVQTYTATGIKTWIAVALDPNGTSFWGGGVTSGGVLEVVRFNIGTGAIEVGPVSTGVKPPSVPSNAPPVTGMCVKGEERLNIVPLVYNPGTNVVNFAAFGDPTITSGMHKPNFHTWTARFDLVKSSSSFTFAVSATEIAANAADLLSRFDEYFCNQARISPLGSFTGTCPTLLPTDTSTFHPTLAPIPYADANAVFYRVENPPAPSLNADGTVNSSSPYSGNVLVYVAFTQPTSAFPTPTLVCAGGFRNPRLFRDPSLAPPDDAAANHSFAFDSTVFVNSFGKFGDPTYGNGTFNDYLVADRCPSVAGGAGATASFNPPPKATVSLGSTIPIRVSVVDAFGNAVTDAITFPNDMSISIVDSTGALEETILNRGSNSFFSCFSTCKVYGANLDSSPLKLGLTTICITSVDKSTIHTIPGTGTGPGEFPPICTQVTIVPAT